MSKVYIGFECSYNGADEFRHVVKVFDCEVKALVWKEDMPEPDVDDYTPDWREVVEMEVE